MTTDVDDNAKPDLTNVTTEELLGEICDRCEGVVIGYCTLHDGGDGEAPIRIRSSGKRLVVRGLVADIVDWTRAQSADESHLAKQLLEDRE